mmetsp:Transcript_17088/g.54881  ORF Transcript_17088/g.54881 Transcript_17088/m.54881 type:complete len:204 (-) Transcript_17088:663-1274(-)
MRVLLLTPPASLCVRLPPLPLRRQQQLPQLPLLLPWNTRPVLLWMRAAQVASGPRAGYPRPRAAQGRVACRVPIQALRRWTKGDAGLGRHPYPRTQAHPPLPIDAKGGVEDASATVAAGTPSLQSFAAPAVATNAQLASPEARGVRTGRPKHPHASGREGPPLQPSRQSHQRLRQPPPIRPSRPERQGPSESASPPASGFAPP